MVIGMKTVKYVVLNRDRKHRWSLERFWSSKKLAEKERQRQLAIHQWCCEGLVKQPDIDLVVYRVSIELSETPEK